MCRFLRARFGEGPPPPEDISQATFEKFSNIDGWEELKDPKTYLFRMATNLVVDYHRCPRNQLATEGQINTFERESTADHHDPEALIMSRQKIEIIERVLSNLPERDRNFVLMNRIDGMTYTEIAEKAGMSRTGVQKIITQALQRCVLAVRRETHES